MQTLNLLRITLSDAGTFGKLDLPGGQTFFTGECPARDNRPGISCIPPGSYLARVTWSPRFQRDLYELQGVPGRSNVRIHPANFMGDRAMGLRCDLEGCIGLGMSLGKIEGQAALLDSRRAIMLFMQQMQNQTFQLAIQQ